MKYEHRDGPLLEDRRPLAQLAGIILAMIANEDHAGNWLFFRQRHEAQHAGYLRLAFFAGQPLHGLAENVWVTVPLARTAFIHATEIDELHRDRAEGFNGIEHG